MNFCAFGYNSKSHKISSQINEICYNLEDVDERVLFVHTMQDSVASFNAARDAYDSLNTDQKFVELDEGDPIIMRDYDRQDAIGAVVNFRNNS